MCHDTQFFQKLYSEEGKGIFDCRSSILGYVQQGDIPSPFDRKNAVTMPARACSWILDRITNEEDFKSANFTIIGVKETSIEITNVEDLVDDTDFKNRIPKNTDVWIFLENDLNFLYILSIQTVVLGG